MNKRKRATVDPPRLYDNLNLWWLGIKVARLSFGFYLLSVFSMTILSSSVSKPMGLFLNPIETFLFGLYPLSFSSYGIICSGTKFGNPQTLLKQFRKPFSSSSVMFVNGFVTSPGKVNSLSQERKDKTSKMLYTPFSFTDIRNTSFNSMLNYDYLEVNQVKFGNKISRQESESRSSRQRKRALQLRNYSGRGHDLYDETSENNAHENDRHGNQANDQNNIYEKLLIVCGPSGVGKSTLIKRLMAEYPSLFGFSISHTTRLPRPGELEGVDYYYISKSEFETAIGDEKESESDNQTTVENIIHKKEDTKESTKGKTFLEYARVHGNLYGTTFKSILDLQTMKKIGILDIDVQGVKNIKNQLEKYKQNQVKNSQSITISNIGNTQKSLTFCPIYLFVAPPDPSKLEERLRGRNTEDEESLAKRLVNAKNEIEYGHERGNFDYILVNDQVEDSYKRLKAFIKTQYGETIFDL